MKAGCFYCSSGVAITTLKVKGSEITIETDSAARIVAVGSGGTRHGSVDSNSWVFTVPDEPAYDYIRFECWGNGEQMAWTQPFWIKR